MYLVIQIKTQISPADFLSTIEASMFKTAKTIRTPKADSFHIVNSYTTQENYNNRTRGGSEQCSKSHLDEFRTI